MGRSRGTAHTAARSVTYDKDEHQHSRSLYGYMLTATSIVRKTKHTRDDSIIDVAVSAENLGQTTTSQMAREALNRSGQNVLTRAGTVR